MSNIKPDPKWPAISDPAPTAAPEIVTGGRFSDPARAGPP
jgi:hypothetical protein